MKPKTKEQIRVADLSAKLKPITDNQFEWAYGACLVNFFKRTRNSIKCLECGHTWRDNVKSKNYICPDCEKELVEQERANSAYCAILTTIDNMQVVRMIWVQKNYFKSSNPMYFAVEVMQHWIDEFGKVTVMALKVRGMSRYFDSWIFNGDLEIKDNQYKSSPRYFINPYKIHPTRKILQVIKRNGFKGDFHGSCPQEFFSNILRDKKVEILLKANQMPLFKRLTHYHAVEIDLLWPTIKICIKNNYLIKDPSLWFDYIDLLKYFNKDINNSFYVCPLNLNQAHNKLMNKKRDIQRRQKIEKMKDEIESAQKEYQEKKQDFFGLSFGNDKFTVKVLETVKEFMEEGDELNHCVFTNEYYKKDDSLVLSARIENKPIETIEISLNDLKIVQARGISNQSSPYHDEVIELVNQNIHLIGNRLEKRTLQQVS